jgi:Fe-S cluster assembly protein SufB
MTQQIEKFDIDYSKYDFKDPEVYVYKAPKGLSEDLIKEISLMKGEPEWMLKFRLKALQYFLKRPMPTWGADLSGINFDEITYYVKPTERQASSWDDVPEYIKRTFDRLGIPEAERKFLAGVGAQYESEVVYHRVQEQLKKKGVIFVDTDTALKEYPELFREHFATVVSPNDNKFAALNSAVWSGGTFIYVPKGVHVEIPLQTYFRMNTKNFGQFERTLIIVDEGASVHYIEGCTAPIYLAQSLHAAVVEVICKPYSHVRYTTIQNWSKDVYNLVTKRAVVYEGATMEWVDGNLGSGVNMKYPAVYLKGKGARGDILSIAFAGKGQVQDAGAKATHLAPYTSSSIVSKSISKDGGRASYRGLLRIAKGAYGSKASVRCDALILDEYSRSDTYPTIDVHEKDVQIAHEATVGKIGEDQIFYLMSRGLTEAEAYAMIVLGFIEAFTKELPMEYAVELNRLIQLEMEGSVG